MNRSRPHCASPCFLRTVNDQGASLIRSRHYRDAIDVFKFGLQVLLGDSAPTSFRINASKSSAPTSKKSQAFIFQEPITCGRSGIPMSTLESFTFAMVFNMALSHQMLIEEATYQRQEDYQSALALYEFAYNMHLADAVEVPMVHSCAIVNNMGRLHLQLKNQVAADWCFSTLLSILVYYVSEERKVGAAPSAMKSSQDLLLDECIEGFFDNASTRVLQDVATAAAA